MAFGEVSANLRALPGVSSARFHVCRGVACQIKDSRRRSLSTVVDHRARQIEGVYRSRYLKFRNALATVTGDWETARDVVQEAFAEALRKRDTFRDEGSLEAWVWRIAMRLAIASRSTQSPVQLTEIGEPGLVDSRLDPDLAGALRQLPPRRRLIVFLHYFGDLGYGEIAEVCGVSEGTVAATLSQARHDLMIALETRGASA